MSKALLQEVRAAEAQRAEREQRAEGEGDEEKLKEKDVSSKEKSENRDWKRNDERWLEWLDSKVALLINRNGVDPRDYAGKSYEEELSKAAEPHMKQEDEGKFRCKTCQKLFKATSFVEKHIANKHPELVKHLEEIPYFNNFALDPHRIQPFAHPPPTAGTSQAPPPQAYGLQGPAYPAADYGRAGPHPAPYGGYPPPPYSNGYWDPYAYPYPPVRRLSDRISGFAPGYEHTVEVPPIPASAGLPAKPVATLEPGPGGRRGGRTSVSGPPPPPPPDAKEDPRASAGKKWYKIVPDGMVGPSAHDQNPLEQAEHLPPLPRLSRVLSMPVPSQLGYLRNPRRLPSSPSSDSPIAIELPPEYAHFHEFSLELADSVQMMIQTLLQLSPPQVLDPAKEQFSACSLSIPTPSISAMFTSMKNLNYMSANMSTLSLDTHVQQVASPVDLAGMPVVHNDFDVGEMLQSVGDALSGMAAQAGVDLVLFHGDLGMKHVPVRGDESGISYTLSHVIRQLMGVAHPGDTIEMGLFIEEPTHTSDSASSDTPRQDSTGQSSPIHEHTGPLRCTFHLMHRYASAHSTRSGAGTSEDGSVPNSPPSFRTSPSFKTLILRRLLRHVGASLEEDVPPRSFSAGKTYALTVQFERGSPSVVDPAVGASLEDTVYQGFPDFKISHEPTLEQLSQFAESLKGRKVTLFAHSKGSFAQHLTSYLTAWGLDVTHVSTEPGADTLPEHVEQVPEPTSSPTASREELPSAYLDQSSAPSPSTSRPAVADALSFCLIDDDVAVLRSRLQKARAEQAYPLHLNTRKRPSLANNHRPRSSPQVARVMGLTPSTSALFAPPPVIVHFTSLANFKLVKDVIQSILMPGAGNASRVPEVIVIPKPAGPRRVLTALHTAITKPIVDPFFYPTATSPISPGFPAITPFFNVSGPAKSPGARSATSVRTASDKSARSPKEHTPSSPRGVSETMEYFSDAAARLGASPASGLVIQSPDGQPAGIFFHPKAKGGGRSERTTTPQSERTGTPSDHPGRSRGVSFRRTADEVKSGSSTPEIATTPRRRAAAGTDGDAGADVQPVEGAPPKGKGRLAPHRGESLVTLGPAGSPAGESPAAAGPPLAPPRKPTQPDPLVRHPSDPPPPTSPSRPSPQPGRRLRRPNMDGPSASAPSTLQKKGKPSDTNIVPPISVLIVDDHPVDLHDQTEDQV
ncbi:predicted protein [Postia placenta Mad-698-R]|nr:predicted protein [Postia placenta Mad-698-R]